ncbi:MAG: hypothetical protein IPJ14_16955 [Kineosporiaceae bacterium]|nr:hypothetical protein [Kineosporiaceae bacterium]
MASSPRPTATSHAEPAASSALPPPGDAAGSPTRPASTRATPSPIRSVRVASPTRTPSRATTSVAVRPAGTGKVAVPAEGRPVDTRHPTRVVGTGTAASCTSAAVVKAVAAGGIITFDCGPAPVTIRMTATAKVRNTNARTVVDGGGRVTLSGGGAHRILYQNTCDGAQGWTTTHCQDQLTPSLVVQNLTLADGNSTGQTAEGGGGGAIFVRGGKLTVINSRFTGNRCDTSGPDVGGAAIRVLHESRSYAVLIVGSSFTGGRCSNGGALSSIGTSWTVVNSIFRGNVVTGRGANPARSGTPGGGSGGAIYMDGNTIRLDLRGCLIEDNTAPEGGGAVFFVSNDRTGTATLAASTLRRNVSKGFETTGLPGIFFLGARSPSLTTGTTLAR